MRSPLGLMTGLHRRTGRPVWIVRTSLEVSVVVAGISLGGVFGVGTVVWAVTIGPLVQPLLPLFEVRTGDGWAGHRLGERRKRRAGPRTG